MQIYDLLDMLQTLESKNCAKRRFLPMKRADCYKFVTISL